MTAGILINKMFTVNSLQKLINSQNQKLYKNVVEESGISVTEQTTNLDIFKELYKYMNRYHRNEFFYKNTIINKILLGRHSVRTSTAIRELPIDNNILDVLIINGIGQVYEIKTGLDNLQRLDEQLNAYYKAFSYCNVVTDETHLESLKDMLSNTPTGIIVLTKRGTLHVEKKAEANNSSLDNDTMFKTLRKYEFESIINKVYGKLPEVTQSKYYRQCLKLFGKIDVLDAQRYMLAELKKRSNINKNNFQYFEKSPAEIKSLIYFSKYNKDDFLSLEKFLDSKY